VPVISSPLSHGFVTAAHSFVAVHLLPNKATQADRPVPCALKLPAHMADLKGTRHVCAA